MKAEDVVRHLWEFLPKFTDLFTTQLTISDVVRTGTLVTVTTVEDIPTNIGSVGAATILGVQSPVTIDTITVVDGVATIRTNEAHDLTEDWVVDIIVTDCDPAVDGSYAVTRVPNRYTALFETTAPNGTYTGGTMADGASRGYDGVQLVTVTGVNTLTYTLPVDVEPYPALVTNAVLHLGYRISAGIDRIRILQSYTAQAADDDWWCFVIPTGVVAGKDRHEMGDALKAGANGVDVRQRLIMRLEVMIIARAVHHIAARLPRDIMADVRVALVKSLVRKSFDAGFSSDGQNFMVYVEDDILEYDGSMYAHLFSFEQAVDITVDDTLPYEGHVAFRDIDIHALITADQNEVPKAPLGIFVNLDDEPSEP